VKKKKDFFLRYVFGSVPGYRIRWRGMCVMCDLIHNTVGGDHIINIYIYIYAHAAVST